ncbi:MAG TPA: DUF1624 domain-containing protein [Clostridiaceae bacterium]|nr:DUF1624 domain-containing protein [Clostridiaceae bacterium]
MNSSGNGKRIWEIDFFRGIALILMIYFHVIFDMNELFGYSVSYSQGLNYYIGKTSAILFMLIAGISCSLSRKNTKRAFKILAVAILITIASHLYNPEYGIKFGILHFLGVCILLYPLFSKINAYLLIVIGLCVIALNSWLSGIKVDFDYLFPFGIISDNFISSDYYPLIPWISVFLFGIAIGKIFYSKKQSLFKFELRENIISRVGRRTLLIYIIHQPVIMAVLSLIDFIKQ